MTRKGEPQKESIALYIPDQWEGIWYPRKALPHEDKLHLRDNKDGLETTWRFKQVPQVSTLNRGIKRTLQT